jgi:hypothetical protein
METLLPRSHVPGTDTTWLIPLFSLIKRSIGIYIIRTNKNHTHNSIEKINLRRRNQYMDSKSLIISTIIIMVTLTWLFRYDIVVGEKISYRLDRWTGSVDYILVDEMGRVKQE